MEDIEKTINKTCGDEKDLSEVSSYDIVQTLGYYCDCQQDEIYKYFKEKGYLEYGFDIDNGFFDKNGNIKPEIKQELDKIVKKIN